MNTAYITTESCRVHKNWWTCIPALPRSRSTPAYRALRRVWFDHTMNTFKEIAPGTWRPNARGFYTEGTEDHITPVLFQNWALFPDHVWVEAFLNAFGIAVAGEVSAARWSTSFEQAYDGKKFAIADIAFSWRDNAGEGVLVIEAKAKGGGLGEKDYPDRSPYLKLPSVRAVGRRFFGFLVDQSDAAKIAGIWGDTTPVVTWQTLANLQLTFADRLPATEVVRIRVKSLLAEHFRYFGISPSISPREEAATETHANAKGYESIRSLGVPATIEDFLIGSEVVRAARRGKTPEPPYAWLAEEPDALSIFLAGKAKKSGYQSTAERRIPYWRLSTT